MLLTGKDYHRDGNEMPVNEQGLTKSTATAFNRSAVLGNSSYELTTVTRVTAIDRLIE